MRYFVLAVLCLGAIAMTPVAHADDASKYTITLKDKKFTPQELSVPAGQKIKVTVVNQDPATIEFESHDLRREKLVGPGKSIVVSVGPLDPGKYEYFDEFNEKDSRGFIVAQ